MENSRGPEAVSAELEPKGSSIGCAKKLIGSWNQDYLNFINPLLSTRLNL